MSTSGSYLHWIQNWESDSMSLWISEVTTELKWLPSACKSWWVMFRSLLTFGNLQFTMGRVFPPWKPYKSESWVLFLWRILVRHLPACCPGRITMVSFWVVVKSLFMVQINFKLSYLFMFSSTYSISYRTNNQGQAFPLVISSWWTISHVSVFDIFGMYFRNKSEIWDLASWFSKWVSGQTQPQEQDHPVQSLYFCLPASCFMDVTWLLHSFPLVSNVFCSRDPRMQVNGMKSPADHRNEIISTAT